MLKKHLLFAIGIFLAIIAISGAVWYSWPRLFSDSRLSMVEPLPPVVEGLSNENVVWKSYTDTKFGVTFQYPDYLVIAHGTSSVLWQSIQAVNNSTSSTIGFSPVLFEIGTNPLSNFKTLADVETYYNRRLDFAPQKRIQPGTIDGHPSLTTWLDYSNTPDFYDTWIQTTSTLYHISPTPGDKDVFRKMIASVKFLHEPNISRAYIKAEPSAENYHELLGFISDLYEQDGSHYIKYVGATWFSGEEAVKAKFEDGNCIGMGYNFECEAPDGYYIRKGTSAVRTYELLPNAKIVSQSFASAPGEGSSFDEPVTWPELMKYWNNPSSSLRTNSIYIPFHLTLNEEGSATKLVEQYVP
jgi:hypothetical protein